MRTDLTVIYTDRLDDCHVFYRNLGLVFAKERHGSGPEHYAAVLDDGAVFELYPAGNRPPSGRLRLGFTTSDRAASGHSAGRHVLQDPDGRTVVLTVASEEPMDEQEVRHTVQKVLGGNVRADVMVFPTGNVSVTVHVGGHAATIDGHPDSGWGWTLDPAEDDGLSGHEHTVASLEEVLAAVRGAAAA